MLTVNRRHSIHKQFQATRDRQICRAWRVERHDKTGRQHRSARWVLAITGLRKPTCTGRMIKKCSLAVIGKVSAPASRIQELLKRERIKRQIYSTREAARLDVFNYIEMFYNPKRRHGTSDNLSPVEYERRYFKSLTGV